MSAFWRKAENQLLKWKENYSSQYAAIIEGPRRVGKSTVAEEFAKKYYRTYIKIDFASVKKDVLAAFDDIAELDVFFLRLQAATGITLHEKESVIIFDEIQRFPLARQAIKYLVADGRYSYIETGSLLSIKKNVKDIVIPSEEYKIKMYPMDYEEFLRAIGSGNYETVQKFYELKKPLGNQLNQKLLRDMRLYMCVGGMPQAVAAYVAGKNFEEIDFVKRAIIELYKDDFMKIDDSGRISAMYEAIPAMLSQNKKRYTLSNVLGKRTTAKDQELLSNLLNSKTVLACYNTTDPKITLSQSKDFDSYKLYLADTGLFTTMLFNDKSQIYADIYIKLMGDKLDANLGYLYENLIAQEIAASGHELYYHTWQKPNSSHYYEIDFLLSQKTKLVPIEVKSSSIQHHQSITEFAKKYSDRTGEQFLLSQKDVGNEDQLRLEPIYMIPYIAQG